MVLQDFVDGGRLGAFHAVQYDHLVALFPSSVGRGCGAAWQGLTWGTGHALGALGIGGAAFGLRGVLDFVALAVYLDLAVGLTLIFIGLDGIRHAISALKGRAEEQINPHTHAHTNTSQRGPLLTGILHGLSGTGHAVGVLPAIMLPTAMRCVGYLTGFCLCTALVMAAYTGVAGHVTLKWAALKIPADSKNRDVGDQERADRTDRHHDHADDERPKKTAGRRLAYLALFAGILATGTGLTYITGWALGRH